MVDMKIRFIWVGKTRNGLLRGLITDYLERISKFTDCAVLEIKEEPHTKKIDIKVIKSREGKAIREVTESQKGYNVVVDEKGRELTSEAFAEFVQQRIEGGTRQINFIVGSFLGLSPDLAATSDLRLSLSKLTFTHEMARLILVEQVYRSFTIIHRRPYQK
jgi:23S rRNA (pseudouridine1915-N3)-methyltransferase